MCSAVIKNFIPVIACLGICLTACNNNKSENQLKAEGILTQAQSSFENKKYDLAITQLDSLMKKYPGEIDVQRNAMHLRTLVIEKKTIIDSIANDSTIAANKQIVDSLSNMFRYVKTRDMVEGYFVSKAISDNHLTKQTDIEVRIDDRGNIYLLSSLYGNTIHHTYLKAKCNAGTVETKAVAFDNAKNYRFKDGNTSVEMITFDKEACDTLCQFISENRNTAITIEFCGRKSYSMQLSNKTKNSIADTYLFATRKSNLKKAEDLKKFYAQKLVITRKQSRQTATNINGDTK